MRIANVRINDANTRTLTVVTRTNRQLNNWLAEHSVMYFVIWDETGYICDSSHGTETPAELRDTPTKADFIVMH